MRRAIIIAAAAATGCAPTIEHFNASPQTFCPGDPVTLDWKVVGATGDRATLITEPGTPGARSDSVAAVDRREVNPMTNTTFRLSATNGNGTRERDVQVSTMNRGDPSLTFRWHQPLTCIGSTFQTDAVFALPFPVSPRLRVTAIDIQPGLHLQAVGLSGPRVGDPMGPPWVAQVLYTGPQCPSGATSGSLDGQPPEPTPLSDIGLFVRAECA